MQTSLLRKSHGFSQILHGIEYHTLAAILSLIMVVCLIVLNLPVERHPSVDLFGSSHILQALTRIDDPQYAHEYERRTHVINENLEQLRDVTQSDRTYLAIYNYDPFQPGISGRIRISQTFEVGQEGFSYQISEFQNFPRQEWLQMKRGESPIHWFGEFRPPTTYGLELTNEQNVAIAYVGFEYLQSPPSVRSDNLAFLEHTAILLTAGLSEPLESLNTLE